MDVPETPLSHVTLIDKWTHILMYLGTCFIIRWEYSRCHTTINTLRLNVWALVMPALMSGLIEILQANCTNGHRSGEWLDFLANSIGCALAWGAFACWKKMM